MLVHTILKKRSGITQVIATCFSEQEALPIFYNELISVLQLMKCDYELLLVNDGSSDNTIKVLHDLADKDADVVDGARDFRLMRRAMVEAIVGMQEYNRFSKGIFGWIGFRTYWLPYENVERVAGETKTGRTAGSAKRTKAETQSPGTIVGIPPVIRDGGWGYFCV